MTDVIFAKLHSPDWVIVRLAVVDLRYKWERWGYRWSAALLSRVDLSSNFVAVHDGVTQVCRFVV